MFITIYHIKYVCFFMNLKNKYNLTIVTNKKKNISYDEQIGKNYLKSIQKEKEKIL